MKHNSSAGQFFFMGFGTSNGYHDFSTNSVPQWPTLLPGGDVGVGGVCFSSAHPEGLVSPLPSGRATCDAGLNWFPALGWQEGLGINGDMLEDTGLTLSEAAQFYDGSN